VLGPASSFLELLFCLAVGAVQSGEVAVLEGGGQLVQELEDGEQKQGSEPFMFSSCFKGL